MAPEQASGDTKKISASTDIYALGAILYELLTGRPPYRAASPLATLDQVRIEPVVRPRRLVSTIPRDMETICLKCLSKEPHDRYASAQAVADDLRRFCDGMPIRGKRVGWLGHVWYWMRRVERIREAATVMFMFAVLNLVPTAIGARYGLETDADAERRIQDELDQWPNLSPTHGGSPAVYEQVRSRWMEHAVKMTPLYRIVFLAGASVSVLMFVAGRKTLAKARWGTLMALAVSFSQVVAFFFVFAILGEDLISAVIISAFASILYLLCWGTCILALLAYQANRDIILEELATARDKKRP